ncbi:hypothetical protein KUL49_17290 [Alteromonas sp. KUL49]|nr:hypothetical protein KUL49_17290 [Alteromonas sp. KUL49]
MSNTLLKRLAYSSRLLFNWDLSAHDANKQEQIIISVIALTDLFPSRLSIVTSFSC